MTDVKTTMSGARRKRSVLAAGVLGVLGIAGCESAGGEPGAADTALAQIQGVSQTVNVPDKNGTYFAEINAHGSGCPPGTWSARISEDGQVFTVTFSNYITEVHPNTTINVKECVLALKLHTPEGRSFSVQSFSYSGYALLQQGVTGSQTATYNFQGTPLPPPDSNRVTLVGPHDDDYIFRDDLEIDDRVWSPCGLERELNITTRVVLQNSNPRRSGFMNLTATDGSGKLEVHIQTQKCEIGEPAPTALAKVTNVRVSPSEVQREEPFTITWQTLSSSPDARYKVQVRSSRNGSVIWESPAFTGRSIEYNGPALSPGSYQIVVVARDGSRESTSDPMTLTVTGRGTEPPPPPPPPVEPPTSRIPDWAQPLLGRYATRTDSFAMMPGGVTLHGRQLGLAEFVEVDGGLELRQRVCHQSAVTRTTNITLRTPDAYPEMRRRVTLGPGQRWSVSDVPLGTGFLREGVPQCAGRAGQYVSKRPDQRWISGSLCRCPVPGEAPRLDDCRVTDPDGDGSPGLAYVTSSVLGTATIHAASTVRSHLVGGYVDPNRAHVAPYRSDELVFTLACDTRGACDPGEPGEPCSSDYNRTQFAPLPAPPIGASDWTCGLVRNAESQLFPTPRPSAPSRCTRDELTEEP